MKKTGVVLAAVLAIGLLFTTESFARPGMMGKGSGGWGMGGQYAKMYDTKTVETITGEVVSVDKITPYRGMSRGVHLVLKTDKETIPIHLGPAWYLEKQDIKIMPKDTLEVTGSRITFKGKPAIIAGDVKKGDQVLKLRDENGYPYWSGCRSR